MLRKRVVIAAKDIEKGSTKILSEQRFKTKDMGGKHSTSEIGDAIKEAIIGQKP